MARKRRTVRSGVEKLKPYEPGRPMSLVRRELGLDDVIKLASNECPYPPFPRALAAMKKAVDHVNRYPDDNATFLKEKLSTFMKVPVDRIMIGHGSNELIRLLAEVVLEPGDEAVMASPSFVVYPHAVKITGATPVEVPLKEDRHDLEAMLAAVNEKTKMVFVCNPNNPSGTFVGRGELESFLGKLNKNIVVVMDEAYFELVTDDSYPDGLDYIEERRPIVVLRTFSKVYGLAGCRVGYGVAPGELVQAVNRVRDAFNVGTVGLIGAIFSLDCREEVAERRRLNAEGLSYLAGEFERLGLSYIPSQTNFIMVDVGDADRRVTNALVKGGVIVRPGDALGYYGYIRVSVGTPAENERFVSALERVLDSERVGLEA
ncbi:MAG: histidinol-phosphate transaminase [Actinobacteria bacterium]|nr:histidinol-phosphate transaminase [Actinomycetota bacterium]